MKGVIVLEADVFQKELESIEQLACDDDNVLTLNGAVNRCKRLLRKSLTAEQRKTVTAIKDRCSAMRSTKPLTIDDYRNSAGEND